jgi:predicted Zn-dependent peptidase
MAFKGTSRRSARDIAEEIEARGGEMNAETSVDHTTYYVRLLKDDIALGVDVLGDIISDPLLDADELALEQHVIVQEIGAAHDVPEDWVFDLFQQTAFPGQAIGRTILGTPEAVRAHTPADLRRFLGTHYCGPQMVIGAAGNIDHDALVRLAEQHLGRLPDHRPADPEPGSYVGGRMTETRGVKEAQILLGFAAPPYADDDFTATHLLSAMLGGGMASRLFQELREERGLCYSIYSFYWPFKDTGIFGIQAATAEEDTAELVPLIHAELRKMTDGITPAELQRAKTQLRAGLLMTLESPIARAAQMAKHILIHGRPLSFDEMVEKVDAVEAEQIARLVTDMLKSPPTLAAIGPIGNIPSLEEIANGALDRKSAVGF